MSNTAITQAGMFGIGPGVGQGMWTLVERWEPSAAADTHTFSNLNGDVDRQYMIRSRLVRNGGTGTDCFFRPNNGSGTDTYKLRINENAGTTAYSWTGGLLGYLGDATICNTVVWIDAKSGTARPFYVDSTRWNGSVIPASGQAGGAWTNTTDNITSIVATTATSSGWAVGSYIELWKLSQ